MIWIALLYLAVGLSFIPRFIFRNLLEEMLVDDESTVALGFAAILASLVAIVASLFWPLVALALLVGTLISRRSPK